MKKFGSIWNVSLLNDCYMLRFHFGAIISRFVILWLEFKEVGLDWFEALVSCLRKLIKFNENIIKDWEIVNRVNENYWIDY